LQHRYDLHYLCAVVVLNCTMVLVDTFDYDEQVFRGVTLTAFGQKLSAPMGVK
jgi:hypothetical protein